MKKTTIFLLLFTLIFSIQSRAQEELFMPDGTPIAEIEADLIAVSFEPIKIAAREFYIEINHGQFCANNPRFIGRQKFLRTCTAVMDKEGEPLIIGNYVKGLNMMEQKGWELVTIAVDTGMDGNSEPESHQYMFRKKAEVNP
ncbi:MAG: hypothetical protein AAF696_12135 [Bacteroidota bacterium]